MTNQTVPKCARCQEKPLLRRQINASGSQVFIWYCQDCDRNANPQSAFIKRALVEHWVKIGKIPSIESIPIAFDYRENVPPCEVCGVAGSEYHHWWPQSLAHLTEDHTTWPGADLCRSCHMKWHAAVTPYLKIGRKQNGH